MNAKKLLYILPVVALLAAGCNSTTTTTTPTTQTPVATNDTTAQNQTQTPPEPTTPAQTVSMVKIALNAQNKSGQTGSVTITEVQGKAKVILNLIGQPATVVEPVHVHFGSCANLGDVRYPLTSLSKGASVTTLSVSLAELLSQPFAINAHKSAKEIGTYVACGDSTTMQKTMSSATPPAPTTPAAKTPATPVKNNNSNGY